MAHLKLHHSAVKEGLQDLLTTDAGTVALLACLALTAGLALQAIAALLNFIYVYFIRPGKNLRKYGQYAIVTGATDGIGKAYAFELARRGLDLILVSRTQSKLESVKEEIQQTYGDRSVEIFAIDLTTLDDASLERLEERVHELDVGILVNNAGMSFDHPDFVEVFDAKVHRDLLSINTITPTLLSKLVLPGMKSRRRGVIINIGSANGILPSVSLLSTYAGSKAFINQFTRSMDFELRGFNIRMHDQCPFFVTTKISKIRKPRLDAPTPEVWAKSAVRQIGYETVRTPYWFHGLMLMVIQAVPEWPVSVYVHSLHNSFRRAYYRKQQKKAAEAASEKKGQ